MGGIWGKVSGTPATWKEVAVNDKGELITGAAGAAGAAVGTAGGSIVAATIGAVQSSLTGATFVPLPSVAARWVALQNPNAVDIEYQRGGAGSAYIVRANSDLDVPVLANANELSVRRVDTSNTQVPVRYEVIA